jgi:branched-chain amino acid transport system ATP-binding protein
MMRATVSTFVNGHGRDTAVEPVSDGAVLLEANALFAGYGGLAVVRDLSLSVGKGEMVALVGANGAGKTTTLLTLAGDLPAISGRVFFCGDDRRESLHRRARRGLSFVTEERSVFMRLTVAENLRVGRCLNERALELFPELKRLLNTKAGLLSGGEQQMLTLARAIARQPRVLLVDELSLGLAPIIVDRLLNALRDVVDKERIGVLMVEQHVGQALAIADRAYVMRRGLVELSGPCADLRSRLTEIEASYLSGRE